MKFQIPRETLFFFFILAFCFLIIEPLLLPFAVGVTFAYVCEQPVEWLQRRVGKRSKTSRWLISLGFILFLLTVFLLPLGMFAYAALSELVNLLTTSRGNPMSVPDVTDRFANWLALRMKDYGVNITINQVVVRAREALTSLSQQALGTIGNVLSGAPEYVFNFFLIVLTWVYFLVEGKRFRRIFLPKVIPWPTEREIVAKTTGEVLRATIVANVLVSVVQALIVTLILGVAKIPSAFLWGGMAFFLSFVPVFGTAPIMLGAAAFCFTHDRTAAGVVVLVASLLVGAIDNILRPFLVKGSAELNFFWVFVAFLGGIAQFGLAGAVLGPLAFSLFISARRMLENHGDTETVAAETVETPRIIQGPHDIPVSTPPGFKDTKTPVGRVITEPPSK